MKRRMVSAMTLMLLLTGMLTLAFSIQPVKAEATIYIRADGSIDPPTAPISTVDNVTYTLTGNITSDADGIVVERDKIVVDGAGHAVTGSGSGSGTTLANRSNVTVRNTTIKNFCYGVSLEYSCNNTLSGNNVANNTNGIWLHYSSDNNVLSGNNVTANNGYGIWLDSSSNNTLSGNVMGGNRYNFEVYGYALRDYLHSIDTSNLVDDRPVYYFMNQSDIVIGADAYPEVGYLGFVNCVNVTVQGLDLTNNGQGLLLAFTNNSRITGNNIANNGDSIRLVDSYNNTLSGNNVTANNGFGIGLVYSSNNTLSGNNVTANNWYGIGLDYSYNNTLFGNNVANNTNGIGLDHSSSNTLFGNNVANNTNGIVLYYSSNNVLSGNNVTASKIYGIYFYFTNNNVNNVFYHNNFINNTQQVHIENSGYANSWDDGYPFGGNYWSNYTGVDLEPDGIGDSWYEIDSSNIDHYPLKGMSSDFDATSEHSVQTICNSSISGFQYGDSSIRFNVTGEDGTAGFCRICIPTALMNATYRVFVNGTEIQCNLLPCSNSTHSYLYFSYSHSIKEIVIIPELASLIVLPLFMLATLIVVIICNKKRIDIT